MLDIYPKYVYMRRVADALAMARASATQATRVQTAASIQMTMLAVDVMRMARLARKCATCL